MDLNPHCPIDIDLAWEILANSCKDFLIPYSSGIFDFIIPTYDAILLSLYTGAFFGYDENSSVNLSLDYFEHPEAVYKKRMGEIGLHPLDYNHIPMFSSSLGKYATALFSDVPKRYLILADSSRYQGNDESLLKDIKTQCKDNDISIHHCIIWPSVARKYNKGFTYGYTESFWEYITAIELRKQGMIVSKFHRGGDLSAFIIPSLLDKIFESKLMDSGFFIEELEMVDYSYQKGSLKNQRYNNYITNGDHIFCVEAESTKFNACLNNKHGAYQVRKYINSSEGFYSGGIVSGPFIEECHFYKGGNIGYVTCNDNGEVICSLPESLNRCINDDASEYVEKYMKATLLKNFSFEERCNIIGISSDKISLKAYFDGMINCSFDEVIYELTHQR